MAAAWEPNKAQSAYGNVRSASPLPSLTHRRDLRRGRDDETDEDEENDRGAGDHLAKPDKRQKLSETERQENCEEIPCSPSSPRSLTAQNLRKQNELIRARLEKDSPDVNNQDLSCTQVKKTSSDDPQLVNQAGSAKGSGKQKDAAPPSEGRSSEESEKRSQTTNESPDSFPHALLTNLPTRVEPWLDQCSSSGASRGESKSILLEAARNLPLPRSAGFRTMTASVSASLPNKINVRDREYPETLEDRDVFIEEHEPPAELMKRANAIISQPCPAAAMTDSQINELIQMSRGARQMGEDDLSHDFVPNVIPAIKNVKDQRLIRRRNHLWSKAVPLEPSQSGGPRLPRNRPDTIVGYSKKAFSKPQHLAMKNATAGGGLKSYAKPALLVHFPFLELELRSQAAAGTHYVGTNQAATCGAIAMHGYLMLTKRGLGLQKFDFEEPQYFSLTMDHLHAILNVHWVKPPSDGEELSFNLEMMNSYCLRNGDDTRALNQAIHNVLEYGLTKRLPNVLDALDALQKHVDECSQIPTPDSSTPPQV